MNTYYCTERQAEATEKAEFTQVPEIALIFYLVTLVSFPVKCQFSECQPNSFLAPASDLLL